MQINPNVVLVGETVRLVPMENSHKTELSRILLSPEVWKFTWRTIHTAEELDQVLTTAMEIKIMDRNSLSRLSIKRLEP